MEKVSEWADNPKYFQSILPKCYPICVLGEEEQGFIFYDRLRLLIKLWIDKVSQKQIVYNDLINIANQVKAKDSIYRYTHLDQKYVRGK